MSHMKQVLGVIEDLRRLADSLEDLIASSPQSQPKEETSVTTDPVPTPEQPQMTSAEMRETLAGLITPSNRKQVKAIVQRYGAEKLSDLPTEHYAAVLAEVRTL